MVPVGEGIAVPSSGVESRPYEAGSNPPGAGRHSGNMTRDTSNVGARLCAALAVLAWAGCDGPGADETDATSTGETTTTGSTSSESSSSSETSSSSSASGDSTGTSSGGEPCGGACGGDTPICNVDTDTCVACTETEGCSGSAPFCDTAAGGGVGACVQCLADGDCDDDFDCSIDTCDTEAGACIASYDASPECAPEWTLLENSSPSARAWPSMVYDAAREEVVLFGGYLNSAVNDDTYTWDGETWTLETPDDAPSPRWISGAAYDRGRERVVLFGGVAPQLSTDGFDDTWEWDGDTWTEIDTPQAPPGRGVHGNMTYDAVRETVVLFGGGTQPWGQVFDDVWEYDGTTWTQLDVAPGPLGRVGACFEYAGPSTRVVLFGGGVWDPYFGDTWTLDDGGWTSLDPVVAPSVRQSQMCAYDSFRERLVLFGGDADSGLLGDTWEFDGAAWNSNPASGPLPGCCEAFAYDEARRQVVMVADSVTWTYGPPQQL